MDKLDPWARRGRGKSMADNIRSKLSRLQGMSVLLAEDNDVNALLVSAALQKIGIKVERANNGQEAISLFENKSAEFDLVLMDLHMPVMDGTTAIAAIRNLEQQSSKSVETLPIFALSADEQEENQKAVLSAGANGFLSKPLDPAEIATLVSSPEEAAEVYLASLLVVDEQNFMEKAYLQELAKQLQLSSDVTYQLEQQLKS